MKKRYNENINRFIFNISKSNFQQIISRVILYCITTFIFINMMTSIGGCFAMCVRPLSRRRLWDTGL